MWTAIIGALTGIALWIIMPPLLRGAAKIFHLFAKACLLAADAIRPARRPGRRRGDRLT